MGDPISSDRILFVDVVNNLRKISSGFRRPFDLHLENRI
jgi:hypothetical protein